MIAAQTDPKTGVIEMSINGHKSEVFTEYKAILDFLLCNYYDDLIEYMDKWNKELLEND